MRWSFSGDRCFRRCQRLYFYQEIAASHNAKDPFRREAFVLKQLKTKELWLGTVVHRGIELFVVPQLMAGLDVDWEMAQSKTTELATRQFIFSEKGRYREQGITKTRAGDDYCALSTHEFGGSQPSNLLEQTHLSIEQAFSNLKEMEQLWAILAARHSFRGEVLVQTTFEGAQVVAKLDLLCFNSEGKATIIDWKVSEASGSGDAHLQTALYGWVLCQSNGWKVQNAAEVELLEAQLLNPKIISHSNSEEVFLDLENKMYRSITGIQVLLGSRKFKDLNPADFLYANNPNSCTYCAFRQLCRKGDARHESSRSQLI